MNKYKVKELAIECGASVDEYDQNEYDHEDEYTFTERQLEAFAQAVIDAYVAEQKPAAWMSSTGSVVGKAYKIKRTEEEMSELWWDKHFIDYTTPLYKLEVKP